MAMQEFDPVKYVFFIESLAVNPILAVAMRVGDADSGKELNNIKVGLRKEGWLLPANEVARRAQEAYVNGGFKDLEDVAWVYMSSLRDRVLDRV